MAKIQTRVGLWSKGCLNKAEDVETVQELLKAASEKDGRCEFDPGDIDGKIARFSPSATVEAIRAFQLAKTGTEDGVVDPGLKTISLLSAYEAFIDFFEDVFDPVIDWASTWGPCFPLEFVPSRDYHKGGIRFGAKRRVPRDKSKPLEGYRKHAACDLIVPEGTRIHAVDDGELISRMYHFYRGTYAIEVQHSNFIVRYTEIKGVNGGLKKGDRVSKGDVIAYVGKMHRSSMLHFEMYSGKMSGGLTQKSQKLGKTMKDAPFQRRKDLVNPAPYLDAWKSNLPTAP